MSATTEKIETVFDENKNWNWLMHVPYVRPIIGYVTALVFGIRISTWLEKLFPALSPTLWPLVILFGVFLAVFASVYKSLAWLYPYIEFVTEKGDARSQLKMIFVTVFCGILSIFVYSLL